MTSILVFGYFQRADVQAEMVRLRPLLRQQSVVGEFDLSQPLQQPLPAADLALVLGGDGTILRASQLMGYQQVPTLGINLGKLGFLADVNQQDAVTVLSQLFRDGIVVSEHLMLECSITLGGQNTPLLGLNEIAVHANPPLHLIHVDLTVDGEAVAMFSGDGLIVSTPIGSTAHSLSAGGPILRQELAAFVITPICAHGLTYRPLVDSAERVFGITLHPGSHTALLSVDGQIRLQITDQHRITVKQAPVKFRRVRVPDRSYYSTLREKLHWAVQPHEKL
ncbi:MAG TPA: NAD(+)/NADH kinase [Gemmatales bacterium]|nr:NAD(+)/NADH kinase [Gemmatales bacterium]